MTLQDTVTGLQSRGATLTVDRDQLVVDAPEGVLTPSLRVILSENKQAVIAVLRSLHSNTEQLPLAVPTPTPADRAQWDATLDADIAQARAERDTLAARFNKGADYLDGIAERDGQDSPEYEKWFGVWLDVNEQYKAAEDRLAALEMTAQIRQNHIQNSR